MAFTAVCTHQGCLVASIADGMIVCPCHGSKFSIADGSVTGGPAPAPLAPQSITVSGDTITLP
jgi:Rieske Fe-S protein